MVFRWCNELLGSSVINGYPPAKTGLTTPGLIAGACLDAREVVDNILGPAGIDTQPAVEKLRARSVTVHLWQTCCAADRGSVEEEVTFDGETGLKGKRARFLEVFRNRYGFLPSLENQPSESCLGLLMKMHANRSTEFFPLSRVANFADGRDLKIEPQKIKGTPFLMEATALGLTKKNNEFLQSTESFCHAVRVLMHGYAIVSMADPAGQEWCSLEAALRHVSTVESFSRANSKVAGALHHRVMEAEAAVRSEWAKLGQAQPGISLTAIIDVVSQRHAIWPLLSEFTRHTPRSQKGGFQQGKGWQENRWGENRWAENRWSDKGKGTQ